MDQTVADISRTKVLNLQYNSELAGNNVDRKNCAKLQVCSLLVLEISRAKVFWTAGTPGTAGQFAELSQLRWNMVMIIFIIYMQCATICKLTYEL